MARFKGAKVEAVVQCESTHSESIEEDEININITV